VDHRGDEASLLADSVWDWDTVADAGPEAFGREVGALDKRGRRGGGDRNGSNASGGGIGANGNGSNGNGSNGNGSSGPRGGGYARRDAPAAAPAPGMPPAVRVSPTRPSTTGTGGPSAVAHSAASLPRVVPGDPVSPYAEPPDLVAASGTAGADESEEPPLPDEQRARATAAAHAPSQPVDPGPDISLNVHFAREAGTDRVVVAMKAFQAILRERPGSTRVVVHVPAPGGSSLPMPLRGVAYDAELEAEVRRRVGDGVIDLRLE
jgi:hypothetical protein